MAKELNEDTGFKVSIKTLIAIGFAMATVISMWFMLQADIEEARQLCVPVVTYGIGSISDRVDHGNSGYVVRSDDEFADTVINLMNDKNLYLKLKKNMFQNRGKMNWASIADEWIRKHL